MITKKAQAYWTSPFFYRFGRVYSGGVSPVQNPFSFPKTIYTPILSNMTIYKYNTTNFEKF